MGTLCDEHHHKQLHHHHHQHLLKKPLDIPPRKLLHRRNAAADMLADSPKSGEDAVFSRFLPSNKTDNDSDSDSDPYASDNFRMFEFKVRKCNRSRSHDWTDCPFAHPGEKARRRDPRRFHYSGDVCAEFRKGQCGKGDNCEFAHGVFECWLHPSRYRTEACKDGKNCKRKVCFFAHSSKQLRILPETPPENNNRYVNCCLYCHSLAASPTSTLIGVSRGSPPLSPPEYSPYGVSYKEALNELMASFDAMNVNHDGGSGWMEDQSQSQFLMSPQPQRRVPAAFVNRDGGGGVFSGDPFGRSFVDNDSNGVGGPDLGWVNDLLT